MKVDKRVEPAVREAFAASVAGEPARFANALEAIAVQGDDSARNALQLALSVDAAALYAIHEGQRPEDPHLQTLAKQFAESERWAEIDAATAERFLRALAGATPVLDVLTAEDVAETAFAIGGWLLAAFLPGGKDWTDFLDDILDALEAAPETSA